VQRSSYRESDGLVICRLTATCRSGNEGGGKATHRAAQLLVNRRDGGQDGNDVMGVLRRKKEPAALTSSKQSYMTNLV